MTTMQSGIRDRSTAMGAAPTVRGHASVVHVAVELEWPCLARAIDPKSGATDEIRVRARCTLDGAPHALRGRVVIEAIGSRGETHAAQLADRPMRALLDHRDGWRTLTCTCDPSDRGPLGFEIALPREEPAEVSGAPSSEGGEEGGSGGQPNPCGSLWYVRSDLMRWLGIAGGRYGCPSIRYSARSLTPDSA